MDPFGQSCEVSTPLPRMSLNVENEILRIAMETNFNKKVIIYSPFGRGEDPMNLKTPARQHTFSSPPSSLSPRRYGGDWHSGSQLGPGEPNLRRTQRILWNWRTDQGLSSSVWMSKILLSVHVIVILAFSLQAEVVGCMMTSKKTRSRCNSQSLCI